MIALILLSVLWETNCWEWEYDTWSFTQNSSLSSFFNHSTGPSNLYWQHSNESITLNLYDSKETDSKYVHLIIDPLAPIQTANLSQRLRPRSAVVRATYVQPLSPESSPTEEIFLGSISLSPYSKLVLSWEGAAL
jgi:hypothetical protein